MVTIQLDLEKILTYDNRKVLNEERGDVPLEVYIFIKCNQLMEENKELKSKIKLKEVQDKLKSGEEAPDISSLEHKDKVKFIKDRKEYLNDGPFYKGWDVGGRAMSALEEHFLSLDEFLKFDLTALKKLDGVGKKTAQELFSKIKEIKSEQQ